MIPSVGLGVFLLILLCSRLAGAAPLDLATIYAQALQADPRVKIAQHALELGQAQADQSLGRLLPQANGIANLSYNEVAFEDVRLTDQNFTGQRYALQVRQALFNWAAWANRARTNQVVDQREVEMLDTVSQLLVDVAQRYFSVLLAENDLRLIRAEKKLVRKQLQQTAARYQRQLVRVTEYLETQARADRVRTDEIEAEHQVDLARESLGELTGQPVGALVPLKPGLGPSPLKPGVTHWTTLALAHNLELRGQHQAVLAAEKGVQEALGGHSPTVNLMFSYQLSDVGFDNQQYPRRDTQYVGLDLVLPLFSGGATAARAREARARYRIARVQEDAVRRAVLKRVRGVWLKTRSARKRMASAKLSVQSATQAAKAMRQSFRYGIVTAADVLAAVHGQTQAWRDYQQAQYQYIVNWLALKRESGLLQSDDLRQVNDWLAVPPSRRRPPAPRRR